jgi:hypothetical protein
MQVPDRIEQQWQSTCLSEMDCSAYDNFIRSSWKSMSPEERSLLIHEPIVLVPEDNQHPGYFAAFRANKDQDLKGRSYLQREFPRPPSAVKGYMKVVSASSPPTVYASSSSPVNEETKKARKKRKVSIKEIKSHMNDKEQRIYDHLRKLKKDDEKKELTTAEWRNILDIIHLSDHLTDEQYNDLHIVRDISESGVCDRFISKLRPPAVKPRTETEALIRHKKKHAKSMSKMSKLRVDSMIQRRSIYT